MANPKIDFKLDDAEFRKLASQVMPEKAEKGLRRTAGQIERAAAKRAPVETKNLVNTITKSFSGSGYHVEAEIKATATYALFVHEGTGLFGPKAQKITPVNARALKIMTPNGVIYRKSSKGQKPQPFLKDAFEMEAPKLIPRILE